MTGDGGAEENRLLGGIDKARRAHADADGSAAPRATGAGSGRVVLRQWSCPGLYIIMIKKTPLQRNPCHSCGKQTATGM